MLDNPLITLLIATIIAGEAVAGIPGTPLAQAFQPTQQGVDIEPTVFIYKVGDHPLGHPSREDTYNGTQIIHTETQDYETTFQVSALSIQNPDDQTQYTASDILNLVRSTLQSTASIASLFAQGVGMLRIEDVKNVPFQNDFGRNEYGPVLDFTVQHQQITTSISPMTDPIKIQLDRV